MELLDRARERRKKLETLKSIDFRIFTFKSRGENANNSLKIIFKEKHFSYPGCPAPLYSFNFWEIGLCWHRQIPPF